MNDQFEYRVKNVEISIEGNDYVEFDHALNKEILRRPASNEEKEIFSDDQA